ncbi:hypothetical protein EBZ37_02040 [bacterium]|nr:hypothetical protein [bacterium]
MVLKSLKPLSLCSLWKQSGGEVVPELSRALGWALFWISLSISATGCFKKDGDLELRGGSLGIAIEPLQESKTTKLVNASEWTELQARVTGPNAASELNGVPVRFQKIQSSSGTSGNDDAVLDCYGTESTSCEIAARAISDRSGVVSIRVKAASSEQVQSQFEATIVGSSTALQFVVDVNEAPTALSLTNATVSENNASQFKLGSLSSTDPDEDDSFEYSLVNSEEHPDNSYFEISGSDLKLKTSANYEAKSNYEIGVRTTDANGLAYDKTLNISVTNLNEAPTGISLSSSSVSMASAALTPVGTLTTSDEDSSETFVNTLVSGAGDQSNAHFSIDGEELSVKASVFEQCGGGIHSEKNLSVTVNLPPPTLSYPSTNPTYVLGSMISSNTPLVTGCPLSNYSITPDLPAGLSFSASTGAITGRPLMLSDSTEYTISATNGAGETRSTTVNIAVAFGQSLVGADFSGVNLSGVNLSGLDLSNVNLSHANLSGADLSGTLLFGATLLGADLTDAVTDYIACATILPDGSTDNSSCAGANLAGLNLAGANLSGANLHSANLTGTNLTGANLLQANLNYANLTGANLTGATITSASLNYANLSSAMGISGATLNDAMTLNGVRLSGINMAGFDATNKNLSAVDFSGTTSLNLANLVAANTLEYAKFSGNGATTFENMNVSALNLSGFDPTGKTLKGANLSSTTGLDGAKLSGATTLESANLSYVEISNFDFTGKNVVATNFSYTKGFGPGVRAAGLSSIPRGANFTGATFANNNVNDTNFDRFLGHTVLQVAQ